MFSRVTVVVSGEISGRSTIGTVESFRRRLDLGRVGPRAVGVRMKRTNGWAMRCGGMLLKLAV